MANQEHFSLEDLDRMNKEVEEIDKRMRRTEERGLDNIVKYFDRIHDKLFEFNNILIAAYFALGQLNEKVSIKTILIPLLNLCVLVYIEYRMMEMCRFEADVTKRNLDEVNENGERIAKTNVYSLAMILTTAIVTLGFLYLLIFVA